MSKDVEVCHSAICAGNQELVTVRHEARGCKGREMGMRCHWRDLMEGLISGADELGLLSRREG